MDAFLGHHKTPIVILLSRSRSGSNYLKSLLNSHPRICLEGEIFRREEEAAREFDSKLDRKAWTVRGAKLFYYHPLNSADRTIWDLIAQSTRVRIIHLHRTSVIRLHVSSLIAQKTGEWHSNKSSAPTKESNDKRIRVSLDNLSHEITFMKECRERALERCSNRPILELTYEDLVRSPQAHLDQIFDFLNLPRVHVSSTLKKQNPEPPDELIENFEEVEAFASTRGIDLNGLGHEIL